MDDEAFVDHVADRLGGLPGVQAVTLGGSRAEGTHRPDSDWDFSLYYRGQFDPQALRDVGWPGEVSEIGGWSKGVFNGGAWLEIDGRKTDVHYRDLDVVDREIAASQQGLFSIEQLAFHLAGLPSYLVLAELSVKRVLLGSLPTPGYPVALRRHASEEWWRRADITFGYARSSHSPQGRLTQCVGLVAQATSQAAHAVLAARGAWVTNEKTLLTRAGLRRVDEFVAAVQPDPGSLRDLVDRSHAICLDTLQVETRELMLEEEVARTGLPGSRRPGAPLAALSSPVVPLLTPPPPCHRLPGSPISVVPEARRPASCRRRAGRQRQRPVREASYSRNHGSARRRASAIARSLG